MYLRKGSLVDVVSLVAPVAATVVAGTVSSTARPMVQTYSPLGCGDDADRNYSAVAVDVVYWVMVGQECR